MALGPRAAHGLCCISRPKRHPGYGPLSSNVRRQMARLGDVFAVQDGQATFGLLHYVARDSTQLHSHVVRAFKCTTIPVASAELERLLAERPSFVAHVVIPVGIKHGVLVPAGRVAPPGQCDTWFRQANDYGNQSAESANWSVWQPSKPMTRVTHLSPEQREYEVGLVVNPHDVLHRLRRGAYEFFYPAAA